MVRPDLWGTTYGCDANTSDIRSSGVGLETLKKRYSSLVENLYLLDQGEPIEDKYRNPEILIQNILNTLHEIQRYERARKVRSDKGNP